MMLKPKKIFMSLVLLCCTLVLLLGCGAYFNTFYNAKQFFHLAEKKRLDQEKKALVSGAPTPNRRPTKIAEYEKAIEKGSKVLQLHPKSKYVDDAIMIIGKSFYHTREFIKARRKFEELLTYFPQSNYVPQARLWLGRSLVEAGEFETALTTLNDIVSQDYDKAITSEAQILLGELHFAREDFTSAIQEFSRLLDQVQEKSRKISALLRAGEAYLQLQQYDNAVVIFKQALDLEPELEQRYSVELNYAKTLRRLGEHDRVLAIFDRMSRGALTKDEVANVRMEIARTYIEMQDYETAQITFEEVARDYAKSEFAVRAYFELGKMYVDQRGDYREARLLFEAGQEANRRSSLRDSLGLWVRNLKSWEQAQFDLAVLTNAYNNYNFSTKDTLGQYTVEEPDEDEAGWAALGSLNQGQIGDSTRTAADSTAKAGANADSLKNQTTADIRQNNGASGDSIDPRRNLSARQEDPRARAGAEGRNQANARKKVKMKVVVPKNFAALEEKWIMTHNRLAELYLFQFEKPDSALVYYNILAQNFYDHDMGAHWLFLESSLLDNHGESARSDSLFKRVIDRYPQSVYADEARKRLGLVSVVNTVDSAEVLFQQAEEIYMNGAAADSAILAYREVIHRYPDSDFAPKSLYTISWITEWNLNDGQQALKFYEELQEGYPQSVYAKKAKGKIAAAKLAEANRLKELAQKKKAEAEGSDSTGKGEEIDPRELERRGAESEFDKRIEEIEGKKGTTDPRQRSIDEREVGAQKATEAANRDEREIGAEKAAEAVNKDEGKKEVADPRKGNQQEEKDPETEKKEKVKKKPKPKPEPYL